MSVSGIVEVFDMVRQGKSMGVKVRILNTVPNMKRNGAAL